MSFYLLLFIFVRRMRSILAYKHAKIDRLTNALMVQSVFVGLSWAHLFTPCVLTTGLAVAYAITVKHLLTSHSYI